MTRPPPTSTLFPYTTLFRSQDRAAALSRHRKIRGGRPYPKPCPARAAYWAHPISSSPRSEEHTSELQSLRHLVCRLLLEKKNPQQLRSAIISAQLNVPPESM